MKLTLQILVLVACLLITATAWAAIPEITQVTYTPSPAVPGSTITVFLQLENNDTVAQQNVTILLEDAYPFTTKITDLQPNPVNIGTIDKYGKAQVQFTVYIDPTAQSQVYALPITITTKDNPSGKKTSQNITISGKNPLLKVVNTTADKLLPGEDRDISFTVQNLGTSTAYDITVEMQEDRTITATGTVVERDITSLGAAAAYIATIAPGEQKQTTLKVSVTPDATIKNYTLPIKISYRDSSGARSTDTSYIGLKVFGTAQLDATLKETAGTIVVGQKSDVTIELFNKGLGKTEFTLVELKTSDGTIEKSRQFIGSLGPNDVDTVKTGMTFNKTGTHIVEVTLSYQDSDATMKTTTVQVPVRVVSTTDGGINPILILVVLIIAGFLVWNFVLKKGKKK